MTKRWGNRKMTAVQYNLKKKTKEQLMQRGFRREKRNWNREKRNKFNFKIRRKKHGINDTNPLLLRNKKQISQWIPSISINW